MLKIRIIPTLLVKTTGLFKGKRFLSDRYVGALMPAIKMYNMRDVDEIAIFDIEATEKKLEPNLQLAKDISENCFVPITLGGGINNIKQVQKLFQYGADKIVVNSYLYKNIDFISKVVSEFGSQSIVASVDVKKIGKGWFCFSNNGKINTNYEVLDWCKKIEKKGVGEIILCSIDNDGMMTGYDQELIRYITKNLNLPIISSGGAGSYKDFEIAIKNGASAVAAASIYHFTYRTPNEAKEHLISKKLPIRRTFKLNSVS
jgi:cyclase